MDEVIVIISVALLTAVANLLVRWTTSAGWERAKIEHPRIVAVVSLMRAVGIDPVKMIRALATLIRGKWGGPTLLVMLFFLQACAHPTRAQIRSGILLTARGVVDANRACADVVRTLGKTDSAGAVSLAKKCTKMSNATIDILEAGERALDAADNEKSICAIGDAMSSLRKLMNAAKIFADVPKSIEDALAIGEILIGKCEAK